MTKPIQDQANRMSKVLDEVANFYLSLDAEEIDGVPKSYYVDYTGEDIMNATLIFMSIIGSTFNKSGKSSEEEAHNMGNAIHEFVKKYGGIDTKTFYSSKKKDD